MGKTLEALCIAMRYSEEFPLLIISPAHLREHWKKEILKWFNGIDKDMIKIIDNCTDSFDLKELVYIVSYDIATKLFSVKSNKAPLSKIGCFILDEAHEFKHTSVSFLNWS